MPSYLYNNPHNCLIFMMGIPVLGKMVLILKQSFTSIPMFWFLAQVITCCSTWHWTLPWATSVAVTVACLFPRRVLRAPTAPRGRSMRRSSCVQREPTATRPGWVTTRSVLLVSPAPTVVGKVGVGLNPGHAEFVLTHCSLWPLLLRKLTHD